MDWTLLRRAIATVCLTILALAALRGATTAAGALPARQAATPAASCATAATPAVGGTAGMDYGTPMAGMDMDVEFDQLYIDMMIPHHASIVALSQAALERLTDERLIEIAQAIIATQTAEIEELRGYREQFYGGPDPAPMDAATMGMMDQAMPGMGSMDEMMFQMDGEAQVAAICAADDPDVAFIDLTIPHHEMAIVASEAALAQATHQEIKDFAQRVIADQQAEIDELTAIRAELTGEAPPAASPATDDHDHSTVDRVGLSDALRAVGLTVEVAGSLAPNVPFPHAQTGAVLRLSGGGLAGPVDVQVYEYVDEATAFADAAQILPDGSLPTVIVEWVGPPHFFHAGRVVVLYVGGDQVVLDTLISLLGPQFAGR